MMTATAVHLNASLPNQGLSGPSWSQVSERQSSQHLSREASLDYSKQHYDDGQALRQDLPNQGPQTNMTFTPKPDTVIQSTFQQPDVVQVDSLSKKDSLGLENSEVALAPGPQYMVTPAPAGVTQPSLAPNKENPVGMPPSVEGIIISTDAPTSPPSNPIYMPQAVYQYGPPIMGGYPQPMSSIGFVAPPHYYMNPGSPDDLSSYDSQGQEGVPMPAPQMQGIVPHSLQPQMSGASFGRQAVEYLGARYGGTVKWFSAPKGYGFITPDQGGEDVFIHQSDILSQGYRNLKQGCRVEFCIEPISEGRSKAVQVTGPNGEEPEGGNQFRGGQRYPNNLNANMYTYPYPSAVARGGYPPQVMPPQYAAYYYGQYPYGPYAAAPVNGADAGKGEKASQEGQRQPPIYVQGEFPMPYYNFASNGNAFSRERAEEQASSGYQIVVHNLSWTCTWQELKDAFGVYRPVRAEVISDSLGRSRGFGVLKFSTQEDAQTAIEGMNNKQVAGRPVTVRLDKYA